MKINILFILLILSSAITLKAQSPAFDWAKSAGSTNAENGRSITVDANGNSYITGSFQNTVDFDPGPGVFNLISTGSNNGFILKLDNAGNFIWAKSVETPDVSCADIKLDQTGNIIVTGFYYGTGDFDPGPAVYNLTSNFATDIFILKLNPQGNFVWAKSVGGNSLDESTSCTVDDDAYIYVSGFFSGTVDFNPGVAVSQFQATGDIDAFVLKLDSAGNFVFAKQFGGNVQTCQAFSLDVDSTGNIITTGIFNGTVDFDPNAGVNNATAITWWDMFVLKLDNLGNLAWVKTFGNADDKGLALDQSGNVYVTGNFIATADFDPGPLVNNLISDGGGDIFILKLSPAGNYVWAKKMGNTDDAWGSSIAVDTWGKIYITGSFVGTVDFDPGNATYLLSSNGSYDLFISKLDSMGNLDWAKSMGDIGMEYANSIALDPLANIYTTGEYEVTVDFNPDAGVYNLTSVGFQDIYVHKMIQNNFPVFNNDFKTFTEHQVYPNPSNGVINIKLTDKVNDAKLFVYDLHGKIVLSKDNLYGRDITTDMSMLPNGTYNIKLFDNKISEAFNIVLIK